MLGKARTLESRQLKRPYSSCLVHLQGRSGGQHCSHTSDQAHRVRLRVDAYLDVLSHPMGSPWRFMHHQAVLDAPLQLPDQVNTQRPVWGALLLFSGAGISIGGQAPWSGV